MDMEGSGFADLESIRVREQIRLRTVTNCVAVDAISASNENSLTVRLFVSLL